MDILEFLTVILVGVFPPVLASLMIAIDPAQAAVRDRRIQLLVQFVQPLAPILLLLYIGRRYDDGLATLGLQFDRLGIGAIGVLAFGLLTMILYSAILGKDRLKAVPNPFDQQLSVYDSPALRFVSWLSMLPGIIAEDMVFRGYLVLWLGARTGKFVEWALFSVFLSLLAHLYQGRLRIGIHLIMHATFVLTALAAGNLVLLILFHVLWDTLYLRNFWARQDREKARVAPIPAGAEGPAGVPPATEG